MNKRFPLPKRYWFYVAIVLVCSFLLIMNIFRTDSWTGEKPFSEFVQRDWKLFFLFVIEELIIFAVMFLFALLACRIARHRNAESLNCWNERKFSGIKPGDYDFIWFDFSLSARALILKQGSKYCLYVQEYDNQTCEWDGSEEVKVYDSLAEIRKALFYDFDFYFEENTELDEYGDEKYKTIPPIPPIEEIAEVLYDKSLSFCDYDVIKVIYNEDKTKRFILMKSHSGFYKYTFEIICVMDEDEWSVCYDVPGEYPAYWLPDDKTFAFSFFGTEEEAYLSMKQESKYLQYFE